MKKYIAFISFIILLFVGYLYFINIPKSYETKYIVKEYNIIEKYDKDSKYYNFIVSKDESSFNFISNVTYSNKRKLIKDVIEERIDETLCVKPVMENDNFGMICYKDNEYIDKYIAGLESIKEPKKINHISNVDIYDNEHEFLIWNNKGYTSLTDDKKYNFLNKESYDNLLTYQTSKYIIVADYDQTRTFNKLYIYNNESKVVDTWVLDVDISFDSYFMGEVDGYIYLFDQKNKVQYSLDVNNRKMKITSDKDGAIFYDKGITNIVLDNLVFNQMTFVKENKYNFSLNDERLYLRLYDSSQNIRISDKKIDHIVYVTEEEVFYLVDEKLYSYHVTRGEKLLLVNFEWNFTYLNKIFIFD